VLLHTIGMGMGRGVKASKLRDEARRPVEVVGRYSPNQLQQIWTTGLGLYLVRCAHLWRPSVVVGSRGVIMEVVLLGVCALLDLAAVVLEDVRHVAVDPLDPHVELVPVCL
jgi:hypothetical protein